MVRAIALPPCPPPTLPPTGPAVAESVDGRRFQFVRQFDNGERRQLMSIPPEVGFESTARRGRRRPRRRAPATGAGPGRTGRNPPAAARNSARKPTGPPDGAPVTLVGCVSPRVGGA